MTKPRKSMLYTRSGDAGTTALFGGGRVPKDSPRVEAYGCVDELNSALGVAVSFTEDEALARTLAGIQNELFNIGSELASESATGKAADAGRMFTDEEAKIAALEALIDDYDERVDPLRTFILPSGGHAGALLHLCRTVCRRAERAAVTLAREEPVNPAVLTYLNRLSDLLFVMARYANKAEGREETTWQKG
ncbi:MAG TPA: cob(I)yrinic acid a,c-diamide adenosyltransferase [Dehalococcoidia bacterium]|nr:cob(I)yrinic acid a,c-diamide adenosyltransferase [Dehalococcoidia bacterium]